LIDLMAWRLVHEKNAVYDLILCNPPYVNAGAWMAALMAEFLAEIAWLWLADLMGWTLLEVFSDSGAPHERKCGAVGNRQTANFKLAFQGSSLVV
jgi:methylase of polypeptide subunit release factors